MTLSIIIPSYNEANTLPILLEKIKNLDLSKLNFDKEVILIDDGSSDNTKQIVQNYPDVMYYHQTNQGKGAAVIKGVNLASGDFIIVQDADLEYDTDDYFLLLEKINKMKATVVYGNRYNGLKFFIGYKNQNITSVIANIILTLLIFLLFSKKIKDSLTGMKIYPRDLLLSFKTQTSGFETDHEHTAKILRLGIKIYEVPISFFPRSINEGKKIKSTDFFKAIFTLLKFRFLSNERF